MLRIISELVGTGYSNSCIAGTLRCYRQKRTSLNCGKQHHHHYLLSQWLIFSGDSFDHPYFWGWVYARSKDWVEPVGQLVLVEDIEVCSPHLRSLWRNQSAISRSISVLCLYLAVFRVTVRLASLFQIDQRGFAEELNWTELNWFGDGRKGKLRRTSTEWNGMEWYCFIWKGIEVFLSFSGMKL